MEWFLLFFCCYFFTCAFCYVKYEEKRCRFYLIAFVVPFGVVYTLSFLCFIIPVESGEKISFSATILLAQMVFFGTLLQVLPASSLHLPKMFSQMMCVVLHLSGNCLASTIGMHQINLIELRDNNELAKLEVSIKLMIGLKTFTI